MDCVEPLLKLYWEVLEMATLDDASKTAHFRECIQNYYQRGCYDLPEKYLHKSIDVLQNGRISHTMVQVFAEMFLLADECYPNKQLNVDPLDLLVSTLERYHTLMEKMQDSSSAMIDIYYCRRLIGHILYTIHSLQRSLSINLAKRIWDVCVLHPLHEDVREDVLRWLYDRIEYPPHMFSSATLFEFLHERMCQLDVAEMDYHAFECFQMCLFKSVSYFQESLDDQPAMKFLWKIFLNTAIPEVVSKSKSLIIKLYLHLELLNEFLQTLMTSLMDSLIKLAQGEPEMSCAAVVEKLGKETTKIDGIYGTYISRCIDALDFALGQATTEKQFSIVGNLKSMLSQSVCLKHICYPMGIHVALCSRTR